mgnify:FL=1
MRKSRLGLICLVLVLLLLAVGCGKGKDKSKGSLSSRDYFITKEGFGIKYHVIDTGEEGDGIDLWAVSQSFSNDTDNKIDFLFTLHGDKNFSSLGGKIKDDKKELTMFYHGAPASNQGNMYFHFSLPYSFRHGMQWQIGKENSYSVEHVGAQTVDGTNFADCIKVSYHTHDEDGYLGGTGYMILAKGVGIVKIEFNCNNGTRVTFDYREHRELTKHTISGTIVDSNSKAPVPEIAVQIAYNSWGTQAITDTEGKFSIQAYGPELCLMIGDDQDGILDHHKHVRFWVKEITGDVSNLEIDLSTP